MSHGVESTHESWSRPLVLESNHESYSRPVELPIQLTNRGLEEYWSQSMSRGVELSVVESICD